MDATKKVEQVETEAEGLIREAIDDVFRRHGPVVAGPAIVAPEAGTRRKQLSRS